MPDTKREFADKSIGDLLRAGHAWSDEDAQRLEDCYEACAGMTKPTHDIPYLTDMLKSRQDTIDALRATIAELVEALECALPSDEQWAGRIAAAIAKARETN